MSLKATLILLMIATSSFAQQEEAQKFFDAGKIKLNVFDLKNSLNDFTNCIRLDPQNDKAFFYRGLCYYQLFQPKEAETDFSRAITINSNGNALYYLNRGYARVDLELFDDAILDYSRALKKDSMLDVAYTSRAELYTQMVKYEEALADYNKLLELFPSFSEGYYKRSKIKELLGKKNEAEADRKKAKELGYVE